MTEENGHVEAGCQPDVVARTITVLSDSVRVLADQENRLAADLASVREKRVAAERALATFSGETVGRKRRARGRKPQPEHA